jgi:hypothetical protein
MSDTFHYLASTTIKFQGEAMVVYDDEAAAKAAIMWYNGM